MDIDIWETHKLLTFIAFVIPGFVSLKTYELLFPHAPKDSAKQLIDAVAYSSVNYALLFWPLYEVETGNYRVIHPVLYVIFYIIAFFIAPILWVLIWKRLRTTEFLQNVLPHPIAKPWDYVFGQRKSYWIIVTLKDGKQVAGKYSEDSFVSSSPVAEQLYLEESWILNNDGGFERSKVDTAGVMIVTSEIAVIEFFKITYGENHGEQTGKR
ncbi:MAG: DUF6338 family protein [Alphaproteobacteria bacterium]|nr:DUF6338 family protein [Alphaproteobacteria bacterium]